MTEEEKKMTAYHEAGHALVSVNMDGSVPIHKATIIPRGRALGMVQSLPERDQISQSYEEMIAQLAMAMGGRVAEEIIFGEKNITSGASGDIQQATKLELSESALCNAEMHSYKHSNFEDEQLEQLTSDKEFPSLKSLIGKYFEVVENAYLIAGDSKRAL